MKRTLTIIFLFFCFSAKPCGFDPYDYSYFYVIFNQSLVSAKEYHAFLRSDDTYYTYTDETHGNISLWQEILPNWTKQELSNALYEFDSSSFERFWKQKKDSSLAAAYHYLKYAHSLNFNSWRAYPTWSYHEILNQEEEVKLCNLETGSALFYQEQNLQLKQRYAHQIIRQFHYSDAFDEAINFFENQIKDKYPKNEIYYYTLDQVAGCYYSKEDYEKAAYYFTKVFSNSTDRKTSAFRSFYFCTKKGGTGQAFIKNKEDSISFVMLKNLNSFSDDIAALEELYKIEPNDPRLEVFVARALNELERDIWPTNLGFKEQTLPYLDYQTQSQITRLIQIVTKILNSQKIANRDFWTLCKSYCLFLNNNTDQAKDLLPKVRSANMSDEKKTLAELYEVFSWQEIGKQQEEFLASNHTTGVALYQVSHLYYKNGQLAKSFLCNSSLGSAERSSSKELIDDLYLFIYKPNKNKFEQELMKSVNDHDPKKHISFIKGMWFMKNAMIDSAYAFLEDADYITNFRGRDNIKAKVFSNNTKECFTCNEDSIMVDLVYLSSCFDFIKSEFTMQELASYLLKLDSLCNDPAQWKQKLAHYLIGNYYFNVSGSGYYRGTITGQYRCSDRDFFGSKWGPYEDKLIKKREGFCMEHINWNYRKNFDLAKLAHKHYKKVLELSDDRELYARCLYMMAKCELNDLYNSVERGRDYSSGEFHSGIQIYKQSFEQLKQDYSDTKFYDEIIKECSFFRYYCSF